MDDTKRDEPEESLPTHDAGDDEGSRHSLEKSESRRRFLMQVGAASTALVVLRSGVLASDAPTAEQGPDSDALRQGAAGLVAVSLRVNGARYGFRLDPRVTLLDLLRERMALPGTKKGAITGSAARAPCW